MKQRFRVGGMSCAACSAHVEKSVSAVPGVSGVQVNLLAGSMAVEYDENACDAQTIIKAVESGGYTAAMDDGRQTSAPAQSPQAGRGAEGNEDPYYRFDDFHACPDVLLDGRDGRAPRRPMRQHGRHVPSGCSRSCSSRCRSSLSTANIISMASKRCCIVPQLWTRSSPLARVRRLCTAFTR